MFSSQLDQSITYLGLQVLKTPPRSPQANGMCERVIGTSHRECLDFMMPLTEKHLRTVLKQGVTHYNGSQSHSCLGPGLPNPPLGLPVSPHKYRRLIPGHLKVISRSIVGGLHHEYDLIPTTI